MTEETETQQQLERLRVEHRDLDEVIEYLIATGHKDEVKIQRLKKKKLLLRDQIARLESIQSEDSIQPTKVGT